LKSINVTEILAEPVETKKLVAHALEAAENADRIWILSTGRDIVKICWLNSGIQQRNSSQ
jgi:ABC-type transport system involved in cytochrome bd biosynthesis fused ATPase/permease subunit